MAPCNLGNFFLEEYWKPAQIYHIWVGISGSLRRGFANKLSKKGVEMRWKFKDFINYS